MTPFELIQAEIDRQKALPNSAEIMAQEAANTLNDHVATAVAYLGRAPQSVLRNKREGCDPLENLVKAGAVVVAAIAAQQARRPSSADQP